MTVRPNSAAMKIRLAGLHDAPRIAELCGQLGYPATPEQVVQRLRRLEGDNEHAIYVAETPEAGVVGWLHVCVCRTLEVDAQAEVSGLVVNEHYRGCGIGRLLMQRAEQWAREKGCWAVRLRSNVIRAGAHAFYEKLGYDTIKTQKVFRKVL